MGKVKTKDIDFNDRYAYVELFGLEVDTEKIVANLKDLYAYIDAEEGNSLYLYGKAYRHIQSIARAYAGRRSWIISKKQVSNLIKVHQKDGKKYVKIPYASDYIFRAIFTILDEYKEQGKNIPEKIQKMFGLIRRDCFYKDQAEALARVYDKVDKKLIWDLNYDINSENSSLDEQV